MNSVYQALFPPPLHESLGTRLNCYLQLSQIQPISKLSQGSSTPTLSENWRSFAPRVEEKASHLATLGQIHDDLQTSTALS